jgi:hypothetical protein
LQHVEWRNVVCRDLEELHQELYLAVGRLRRSSANGANQPGIDETVSQNGEFFF